MEFFALSDVSTRCENLQQHLSIRHLLKVCDSISDIIEDNGQHGKFYCLWGEFSVNRELINGGVRFSLPNCPNNLAWTLTCDDSTFAGKIIIHLTVSRQQLDEEFKETIDIFVNDLEQGLQKYFSSIKED